MTYIPDPVERIEAAIERRIDRQSRADGLACEDCKAVVPWDDVGGMVQVSADPDAAAVCQDCAMKIPEYAAWVASMEEVPASDVPRDSLEELGALIEEAGLRVVFWVCPKGCNGFVDWAKDAAGLKTPTCRSCGEEGAAR